MRSMIHGSIAEAISEILLGLGINAIGQLDARLPDLERLRYR